MDKRGISSVVATVSLILLTFAAITIIAGYIIPLVQNSLNEGTECTSYRDYFEFREDFGYNCKNITNGGWLYAMTVGAESTSEKISAEIEGFRLSFIKDGESSIVDVDSGTTSGINLGEIRRINSSSQIEVPKNGEVRTYVYYSNKEFENVEIYPKLKSDRVCDRSDLINVEAFCEKLVSV